MFLFMTSVLGMITLPTYLMAFTMIERMEEIMAMATSSKSKIQWVKNSMALYNKFRKSFNILLFFKFPFR